MSVQGGVNAAMRREGREPLRRLLELIAPPHTVVTGGNQAHRSWAEFVNAYPRKAGQVRHLGTFHTSGRGITRGGRQTMAAGSTHVVETLRTAATPPTS